MGTLILSLWKVAALALIITKVNGQDECVNGADNCNCNAGANCTCEFGYRGNGVNCTDVNECLEGSLCNLNTEDCFNSDGSHACFCKLGYSGIPCTDKNECVDGPNNCHARANCTNTEGSYTCACNPGYEGDGLNCNEINECDRNTHNCNENAECSDTEGSFTCTCNRGYTGDGITCAPSTSGGVAVGAVGGLVGLLLLVLAAA